MQEMTTIISKIKYRDSFTARIIYREPNLGATERFVAELQGNKNVKYLLD